MKFTKVNTGRYSSHKILKNEKGDAFKITITGTSKAQVQNFIDYQNKKRQGITAATTLSKRKTPSTIPSPVKDKVYTQKRWKGVSINIRLVRITNKLKKLLERPLTLHYEIDPPINLHDRQDYTFHNLGIVNIKCVVTDGEVSIELFEFTDDLHSKSNQKTSKDKNIQQTVLKNQPGIFNAVHDPTKGTGSWNFRVIGNKDQSKYKISLDLVWDLTKEYNLKQALLDGVAFRG